LTTPRLNPNPAIAAVLFWQLAPGLPAQIQPLHAPPSPSPAHPSRGSSQLHPATSYPRCPHLAPSALLLAFDPDRHSFPFPTAAPPAPDRVDPASRRRSSTLPSFQLVAVDLLPLPPPSIQLLAASHCAELESKTWFSRIVISDCTLPSIWASSTCVWASSLDPSLPLLGQAHPLLRLFDGLSPSR
jgi:hypothetical protein